MIHDRAVRELYRRLDRVASPRTKAWWEGYMKGVIPFRGVGIPAIRQELADWRKHHSFDSQAASIQLDAAIRMFHGRYTEDKLAGILYLQDYLLDALSWRTLVRRISGVFRKQLIYDWNTCDWLCVRVLGPLIGVNGRECAETVASWSKAGYLWKARASVVSFVKVADQKQFHRIAFAACKDLIVRDERFAKTAVGWLLRDMSNANSVNVRQFIRAHHSDFSPESIRNATGYLPTNEQQRLIRLFKEGQV